MIEVKLHSDANGMHDVGSLDDLARDRGEGESLLWIDLTDPQLGEMERVGREFRLHTLAVEDAIRRHQRPKIDIYDDSMFIVFYALELEGERPCTRELSLFVGKHWVVSAHEGALEAEAETARRWAGYSFAGRAPDSGLLVYALLDSIVDGYFPVVDAIAERTVDLETAVFAGTDDGTQAAIFELKKDLLAVRRVIGPERDVMNVLIRRDAPLFSGKEIAYFQDVYDHLLRITDSIDLYRDLLATALDASLSMTSHRLNVTLKRMTSGSIILMSIALVAGVYGMSFAYMPELNWQLGYPLALGLMAVIGGGLAWLFHRADWL